MVAELLRQRVIDMAQLHGTEDEHYLTSLRRWTRRPIIQAFRVAAERDVRAAERSGADYILLDSGGGTGRAFDWDLLRNIRRPYFLAGGLTVSNVSEAVRRLRPYAVDVSSGIETEGRKDREKMTEFVQAVRGTAGKEEDDDKS